MCCKYFSIKNKEKEKRKENLEKRTVPPVSFIYLSMDY